MKGQNDIKLDLHIVIIVIIIILYSPFYNNITCTARRSRNTVYKHVKNIKQ